MATYAVGKEIKLELPDSVKGDRTQDQTLSEDVTNVVAASVQI
jgi:hypothetical protein